MKFLSTINLIHPTKPLLVFDADSVLLDWCRGFTSFLNSKGICTKHVKHLLGTTQHIPTPEITQIDCKQINRSLMSEFAGTDWLERLPVFQEEAINYLRELSNEYNIVVLTCIGETDDIVEKRTKNLVDLYGDIFSGIICINYGCSKEDYLKALHDEHGVSAFVDDRLSHINESISAGITPILFSRGVEECNEATNDEYMVMSCWTEINTHLS
jgi:hypothetical protein